MTKIMLVEDDKSLREIYGVRLLAEGYDIVSAGDGEEALAMAIKERPALIITDVMMPRISGFDMLDILRSTTETKTIKVIMMTALSSEDQRRHGEQLGADRYLVKSQVGIEDVVRVVHEVLADKPGADAPTTPAAPPSTPPAPAGTAAPTTPSAAMPTPAAPTNIPTPSAPSPTQAAPAPQPAAPRPADPMVKPMQTPPLAPAQNNAPAAPSNRQRIIQPINDPTTRVNINSLLDKELAREAGVDVNNRPTVATTQEEKAMVANQLNGIAQTPPPPAMTDDGSGFSFQTPPVTAVPAAPLMANDITAPASTPPPAGPARPAVQAPPRPNITPLQPRTDGAQPPQRV